MARTIRKHTTFNKHAANKNFQLLAETKISILYRIGDKIYWYKKKDNQK